MPEPTAAATVAELEVTVFPYWSCMVIWGCCAKAPPFVAGAVGCCVTPNLLAAPKPMVWLTVASV